MTTFQCQLKKLLLERTFTNTHTMMSVSGYKWIHNRVKKFPVDGVVVIIVSALSLRDKEILSDRPCS